MNEIVTTWPQAGWEEKANEPETGLAWKDVGVQPGNRPMSLGDFSKSLRAAGILDNQAVDLPGGFALLPHGVDMLNLFRDRVHAAYRAHGLAEYEYPSLAPLAAFAPTAKLFDLSDELVYAHARNGDSRFALLPTGEAAIYTHWNRIVRRRENLPIRMYRRASYFRPMAHGKHSGRGVLQSAEGGDVFEFHCAFATSDEQRTEFDRCQRLLETFLNNAHVPVIWSTRPPWSNRREVALSAAAADVPLPVQATAQVACLYNQGTRFSEPYEIGFREHGLMHYAQQLAGYVSRRLWFVHLMLGMNNDGSLFVHPDFSTVHAALLIRSDSAALADTAQQLAFGLRDAQLRAKTAVVTSAGRLKAAMEAEVCRGTPLVVLLFPPRTPAEAMRVVVRRSDTGQEAESHGQHPQALVRQLAAAVEGIGHAYRRRAGRFFRERVQPAAASSVRDIVAARCVAVCPLTPSEEAVLAVAEWKNGEVLGYSKAPGPAPCILTNRPVGTVAFISPRI
jgi:hypothetical protein